MNNQVHTALYRKAPVQSRVAAGFSWFSKNIPKPFLTYTVACMLCSVAPYRETQLHAHCYEYIEYFTQCGSSPDGEELPVDP